MFKSLFFLFVAQPKITPYPGWILGADQSSSNIFFRLRRKIWHQLKVPYLTKWLMDLQVYLFPHEEICRSIFLTGYYEPNQFAFLDKILKPGMTFIDIGANMGLYTLFAAKKIGSSGIVLAIEPSTREFQRLQANIKVNNLNKIQTWQIAVSNCQTEAELLIAVEEHPGHNTLGTFGYEVVKLQNKERVKVERLDTLIKQANLTRVDVIKMDIEGAEYFALQGAVETLTRFHPILVMELSDRTLELQGCNSKQVWDFLTGYGYQIYVFDSKTGLPTLASRKAYYDAENILAIYKDSTVIWGDSIKC